VHDAITASDMFDSGTEQGRVFVHEGGEGIATRAASVIRPAIGSTTTGFGAAVSSGDVNGDGFEDVVVGTTGIAGTGVTVHCLDDGIWRLLLRTEVPGDMTNLGGSLARRRAP
jgi:hypothetical protein